MTDNIIKENLILPRLDITLERIDFIKKICSPLKKIGISFFNYLRVYNDGSIIDLNNAPGMHEAFYYQTQLYQEFDPITHKEIFANGFTLYQDSSFFQLMRNTYDIDNVIAYIIKTNDYTEFWQYGSQAGNRKIIQTYLNQTELLKQFCRYFIDKSGDLFNMAIRNRFNFRWPSPPASTLSCDASEIDVKSFIALLNSNQTHRLTSRESECLKFLVKGFSAKEIAQILNISNRTVEKHLENIRGKTGYHKLSKLISTFPNSILN
jgi:DNA-binding CsgD family transcriptional regulator